eukprot:gene29166-36269_t
MAMSDETLFRLLVPDKKIGSVIGKGGNIIKQLREESGARIKVADSVGGDERVVMISGKDDPSLPFSVAQEALFQVHQRVYEGELPEGEAPEGIMTTRMLVEGSQAGSLIGKGGKIIKYGLNMFQQGGNQMLGMPGMLGMGGLGGMAAPLGQMGGHIGGVPMPQINSRITVSPLVIGSVIGKGGSNIQQIRTLTGAKVKVHDKEPGEEDRVIEMTGSADQ